MEGMNWSNILVSIVGGIASILTILLSVIITMASKRFEETKSQFKDSLDQTKEQFRDSLDELKKEFKSITNELKEIKNSFNATQISVAVANNTIEKMQEDVSAIESQVEKLEKLIMKRPCLNGGTSCGRGE